MIRALSLGNGNILVNLDEIGRVIDFYYPYVGMENQTSGNPIRIAIWDGNLTIDEEWKTMEEYVNNYPIAEIRHKVDKFSVFIDRYDFVDIYDPIYVSIMKIFNEQDQSRRLKIFFINDFNLYSNPLGDTGFYDPDTESVIHYKSRRYIAVKLFGLSSEHIQFTVSKGDIFEDLKDGNLSGNLIDNGNVQSAVGLEIEIPSKAFSKVYFALVASRSLDEVRSLLTKVTPSNIEKSFVYAYNFWKNRLEKIKETDEDISSLLKVSISIIKSHMDNNGSIVASSDYSFFKIYGDGYNYCWPRDAAIASHALDVLGYGELALKHYNFIKDVVSSEGFVFHKYNPDKTLASSWHPWIYKGNRILPIQEDETALEVWAISNHYKLYKDLEQLTEIYRRFFYPAIKFLMRFISDGLPKPSFDLWEERFGIHIYTVSTVYGALKEGSLLLRDFGDESLAEEAKEIADEIKDEALKQLTENDRFIRRLTEDYTKDYTVDASMISPALFGLIDARDKVMINTINLIENKLNVNGGIIRYENDNYRKVKSLPNPWLITTLWLSEYYSLLGNFEKANKYLKWVISVATPTKHLPEQVDPETLLSTSVVPLVWSHAEFIIAYTLLKSLR